jgi:hypothetical protein
MGRMRAEIHAAGPGTGLGMGAKIVAAATLVLVLFYLWLGVLAFRPVPSFGWNLTNADRVSTVTRGGAAERAGIHPGDHVLNLGQFGVGYRLGLSHQTDAYVVRTPHGDMTVRPRPVAPSLAVAFALFGNVASCAILSVFAALLYVRRPGRMALAFWLYAATAAFSGIAALPLLDAFPDAVAVALNVLLLAVAGYAAGIPLIPFALRFPADRPSRRALAIERWVWVAYGCGSVISGAAAIPVLLGDYSNLTYLTIGNNVATLPLFAAVAIFVWRYRTSEPLLRARTAWALTGFIGTAMLNIICSVAASSIALVPAHAKLMLVAISGLTVLANLFPLLAIYPILRFRLFDLGFVVNRATLFTVVTFAALAILAAANWLAQRLVTDRLAAFVQPVVAIVLGFGYFRARALIRDALERLLFRHRYASEQRMAALGANLALAQQPATIDAALTAEAAAALSLHSAALFALHGDRLERRASIGWDEAILTAIEIDDALVLHGRSGLPAAPRQPVVAIALEHAGRSIGAVFYGRHVNDTEIDPEEMALLRDLCAAAAAVYDSVTVRAELAASRAQYDAIVAENAQLHARLRATAAPT